MRDIDQDLRNSLERLTDPHDKTPSTEALWGDLVDRRRKRRNRNRTLAALPLLLVAALAVGIFSTRGSDDTRSDVAAGGADAPGVDGSWRLEAVIRDGEQQPTTNQAALNINGDTVIGHDGCGNDVQTRLDGNTIAMPGPHNLVGCLDDDENEDANLLWEVLYQAPMYEVRNNELRIVTDTADGLIFERVGAPDETATGTLRVESIQVFGNGPRAGGTERAVVTFNEPLPEGEVQYVADIASAATTSGMVWTTQGPNSTHLCDSRHSVPAGAVGSVDLLVPASWFAEGDEAHTGPDLETVDDPAKFPICGPHNGFIQYSMWAPLSADPAEVFVGISDDRTTVTVEVMPAEQAPLDRSESRGHVGKFIALVQTGEIEAAATLWSGYPQLGSDNTPADRATYVEDLLANPTFARILGSDTTTTFVLPSTDEGIYVVTVFDPRTAETAPAAMAFLTGRNLEPDRPGTWIYRLPLDPPTTATVDLPADSYVQPGQDIVVPGVPLEGGARAFVDDEEVPVEVDYDNLRMTITIPDDVAGDVAVTVLTSSPELPGIRAFAVTVR